MAPFDVLRAYLEARATFAEDESTFSAEERYVKFVEPGDLFAILDRLPHARMRKVVPRPAIS